ncbi:MAG: LTA synthase family protein [Clostridia bacterium]|nr:LTA synthase family protein [Clostridia bacterium]
MKNNSVKIIISLISILALSIFLTLFSLYYSIGGFSINMFYWYFQKPMIFFLNFLPILFVMLILYFISNKISISFFVSCLIYLPLTIVNYFKIILRGDPLILEDLKYFKEAANIQGNYVLNFRKGMYIVIFFCIITTFLLYFLLDRKYLKQKLSKKNIIIRITSGIIILATLFVCFDKLYFNKTLYTSFQNNNMINKMSDTDHYISGGVVYSFIHSYTSIQTQKPNNYNEKESENMLYSYTYDNISNEKKVNIISIMLEAFNDFSKFDNIEFENNPYVLLDKIRDESYSGELCTDIFAGGTVTTERSFITGLSNQTAFRYKTNSFAWYFREQGYTVEGSHPGYDWFYNRININKNLGFENYYFYNNYYMNLNKDALVSDNVLFNDILHRYNNNIETGKPYFNFSVTYQNHGPYSTNVKMYDKSYLKIKDGYSNEGITVFNNYLAGIENTIESINNMIEELKKSQEPVVLIFFGDHNPWLGDNSSVYKMLGINLNLNTEEGFYNYYCTPYVIWANNAAKEVLGNKFIGKGPIISPCFLMSEFFELADYKGNEFMKVSTDLKHCLNIVNISNIYKENGKITDTLSEKSKNKLDRFFNIEYYYSHNFKK